jgi:hypothetical protein
MLALHSKAPDRLSHISVGIHSVETFRKSVGIRVHAVDVGNTGETMEKLKLVFKHDENRELKKVECNKAY